MMPFIVNMTVGSSASLSVHVDPVEQTVDAGNAAIFNCSVAGHPIDTLAWYKNGEPLANDTRILIQPASQLVVQDVRRHDQGMYQCFIGNQQETVQGAAQLSLGGQCPPPLPTPTPTPARR